MGGSFLLIFSWFIFNFSLFFFVLNNLDKAFIFYINVLCFWLHFIDILVNSMLSGIFGLASLKY